MKSFLRDFFPRRRRRRPHVRPWALAAPVAVLLVCLPLLRPLRHPDPDSISDDETLRLATIAALVENPPMRGEAPAFRLAINVNEFPGVRRVIVDAAGAPLRVAGALPVPREQRVFSGQPPVMAFILSGPYYLMHAMGLRLRDSVLAAYLLTLIGATLPAAAVAGLAYRMGRLFELKRPARAGLAAAVVFGSGLISYGVVLNSHAPAAALAFGAVGCLVQIAASKEPSRGGGWLATAGFCAALAAAIDPVAIVFPVLLISVLLFMKWPLSLRFGGALLYLLGAAPPLMLHGVLTVPITGNLLPGFLHPELARRVEAAVVRPLFPSAGAIADVPPADSPVQSAAAPTLAESVSTAPLPTDSSVPISGVTHSVLSDAGVVLASASASGGATVSPASEPSGYSASPATESATRPSAILIQAAPSDYLAGKIAATSPAPAAPVVPYQPVTFTATPAPDTAPGVTDEDAGASAHNAADFAAPPDFQPAPADPDDADDDSPPTFVWFRDLFRWTWRLAMTLVGSHGIFSHFPVIVFGLIGIGSIVRRHWPATTKALAAITAASGLIIVLGWTSAEPDGRSAMFANRWFIVFLPLTLFWAGAWLRRRHSLTGYSIAAALLGISVTISIIGAADPMPRAGYSGYTALAALRKPAPAVAPPLLAGD